MGNTYEDGILVQGQNFPSFYQVFNTSFTGNGAGSDSTVLAGIVPYSLWRVVCVGFVVNLQGASTVAEKVNIGVILSDIGSTDDDYFGAFTQDATALKQIGSGDMYIYPTTGHARVRTPDAPANAGTHSWAAGNPDGIGVWQTKQALISVTKKQVASSTATVAGWILIEVGAP